MKILLRIIALTCGVCGVFIIAATLTQSCNAPDIGTTENCRIACVYDRELNGHSFVVSGAGGIIHAPYCKCLCATDTSETVIVPVEEMIGIEIDSAMFYELMKRQWNKEIESIDKNQIVH